MLTDPIAAAERDIRNELQRSWTLFRPFASPLEGLWVLKEEVDELWEAVRANDIEHAITEATQVGAMAERLMIETGPQCFRARAKRADSARSVVRASVELSRDERPRPAASPHEGFGYIHRAFSRLSAAVNDDRPHSARIHASAVAAEIIRFITEARAAADPAAALKGKAS